MRVSDAMSWNTSKSELKAYLGLNGDVSEDTRLRLWLEAAIEAADLYIDRDFVLVKARFLIQSGVGANDVFTIEITPDDENKSSVSYTASSGDTPEKVASGLREQLDEALDEFEFEISGAGANIWAYSGDPDFAFEASASYAAGIGTSGITATYFYDDIPDGVKIGVYDYIKALREIYRRAVGVKTVKTGALSETYDVEGMNPNDIALTAGKGWWRRWKKDRLLDGDQD